MLVTYQCPFFPQKKHVSLSFESTDFLLCKLLKLGDLEDEDENDSELDDSDSSLGTSN
jgi:hypothetical protein